MAISKIRYILQHYFGISHLHDRAKQTQIYHDHQKPVRWLVRQAAFNVARGVKIISRVTI